MPYTLFQGGRRRRRRRAPAALAVLALLAAAGAVAALAIGLRGADGSAAAPAPAEPRAEAAGAEPLEPLAGGGTAPSPLAVRLEQGGDPVTARLKDMPRAGLLFDVDTGRVLWRHEPTRVVPVASLTKMMSALVVADRLGRRARVPITRQALSYRGSGVGLLPRGRRIRVDTMLHGLLLPSGNDAAIALAQRAAGTVPRFVAAMNRRARRMGLACTSFATPEGLGPRNLSCAGDLAALARAVLRVPRLARIVRRREAVLPFPTKGGKLYLYNSNPLLRSGYRGVTGLKTGYTIQAGRCLVVTARRGGIHLGVVLLGSPDTAGQARRLLDRGFAVSRD